MTKKNLEAARYVRLPSSENKRQGKFVCTSYSRMSTQSARFFWQKVPIILETRNRGKEQVGGKKEGEVSHTDRSKKAKDLSGTREADRLYLYVVRYCSCRNARV